MLHIQTCRSIYANMHAHTQVNSQSFFFSFGTHKIHKDGFT